MGFFEQLASGVQDPYQSLALNKHFPTNKAAAENPTHMKLRMYQDQQIYILKLTEKIFRFHVCIVYNTEYFSTKFDQASGACS